MKIGYVALGAVGMVWEHRAALAKALAWPFVVYLLLEVLVQWSQSNTTVVVAGLMAFMVQTLFAVTTHRVVMMGGGAVPEWGLRGWTMRETNFVLYGFILGLMLLPLGLLMIVPYVGPLLMIMSMAYVVGRLSLVFPAIATDQPITFTDSWRMTESHQLLMVLVVVVIPLVLALPVVFMTTTPLARTVASILMLPVTVVVVAALSIAYQVIRQEQPPNP